MPQPETARYRHRTPEVEAVQWTGSNAEELRAFCGADFDEIDLDDRAEDPDETAAVREGKHGTWRGLRPGDWVVRLDEGLYEFSAADFAERYEPAGVAPAPDQTAPACKFDEGCHRVVPCDPGCKPAAEAMHAQLAAAKEQCPDREPLLGVQCTKQAGHEAHSDRPGRIWYPVADDDQTALHDRIAEVLRPHASLGGTPPRWELPFFDGATPSLPRISGWRPLDDVVAALAAVLPASVDRADVYAEIAERLAADAEQGDKEGFTRIYRRSAAKQVREWGDELRRVAAETPNTTEAGPECTCASAGDAFVPAGHYADCPQAAATQQPKEA